MKKSRSEASVLHGITAALIAKGWRVRRMGAAIYGQKGVPDLYAIRNGISVWIECKAEKNKGLSKEQRQFAEMIDDGGGVFIMATSEEFVLSITENL